MIDFNFLKSSTSLSELTLKYTDIEEKTRPNLGDQYLREYQAGLHAEACLADCDSLTDQSVLVVERNLVQHAPIRPQGAEKELR